MEKNCRLPTQNYLETAVGEDFLLPYLNFTALKFSRIENQKEHIFFFKMVFK